MEPGWHRLQMQNQSVAIGQGSLSAGGNRVTYVSLETLNVPVSIGKNHLSSMFAFAAS